jgi:hypothetical protein
MGDLNMSIEPEKLLKGWRVEYNCTVHKTPSAATVDIFGYR